MEKKQVKYLFNILYHLHSFCRIISQRTVISLFLCWLINVSRIPRILGHKYVHPYCRCLLAILTSSPSSPPRGRLIFSPPSFLSLRVAPVAPVALTACLPCPLPSSRYVHAPPTPEVVTVCGIGASVVGRDGEVKVCGK